MITFAANSLESLSETFWEKIHTVLDAISSRLDLPRPLYLGEEHWSCIQLELERFERSLKAGDAGQALGDLKCLVESVARIAHVLDGNPAAPDCSYQKLVTGAHTLLTWQPGEGLTSERYFLQIASQARKSAVALGEIRNDYGGGHGRASRPQIEPEMVTLATDGAFTWIRWAMRRLGHFSEGRPASLIRDLVEEWAIFRSGDLRRRLESANLPTLDPHHQRELGIAVGQRVMQGTFVVKMDGLDPCLETDDLATWPEGYRLGLLQGLWFDPAGKPTATPGSLKLALQVLDPIEDCSETLISQVTRLCKTTEPGLPELDQPELSQTHVWLIRHMAHRPRSERVPLDLLSKHLDPPPF